MTQAQYQHLVSLLNAQQIKPIAVVHDPTMVQTCIVYSASHHKSTLSSHSWIIDNGATSHIASSLSVFASHKPAHNLYVTLPYHTRVPVHSTCVVKLQTDFTLHNVLYVPGFKVNLPSIPAMLTNTSYTATFTNTSCFIQDRLASKVIGKGDLLEGLYVLQHIFPIFFNSALQIPLVNNVPIATWHARLCHVSNKVLYKLSDVLCLSSNISSDCDICPLSKLRHLSFPSNNVYRSI